MKNLLAIITAVIMAIGGWITGNKPGNIKSFSQTNQPMISGAWVWGKIEEINPQLLAETAKRNGISTIYLSVNEYTDWYELPPGAGRDAKLADYTAKFWEVVKTLKDNNIRVEAVAGERNWGQDSHWYLVEYAVDMVRDFNKAHPDCSITGIQLDIEPYGLPDWETRNKEYMDNYYLLIEREANKIAKELPGMRLGLAIPTWFSINKSDGKTILEHILLQLDKEGNGYLALMDYRNTTAGPDGSIALAKPVFDQVEKYSPQTGIVIAQETGKTTPEKITFYGRSRADLEKSMAKLRDYYSGRPAFTGMAVNDLETLNGLQ